MGEEIKILPLEDKPAGQFKKIVKSVMRLLPAERKRENFARSLSDLYESTKDPAGFSLVPYPSLIDTISASFNEDAAFLYENPWMVRRHLDEAGFIAAPDSMLERRKLKEKDNVVLYKSADTLPFVRHRTYKKGLILVKFITLAFKDLSQQEMSEVGKMLQKWSKNPRYIHHLEGLLRWFNARRRLLDRRTLNSYHEIFDANEKRILSSQVAELAASRGASLSATSMKQVERLCALSNMDTAETHALIHRIQCGSRGLAPASDTRTASNPDAGLDAENLKRIESSTTKVRGLLAQIFEAQILEEESEPREAFTADSAGEAATSINTYSSHSPTPDSSKADTSSKEINPLIKLLKGKTEVQADAIRKELGPRASKLEILLEALNDSSYDIAGDSAAELEGDTIYVSPECIDQLEQTFERP